MTIEVPTQQFLITPRAVLSGSGNPNALENVNPNFLIDGAVCWVIDQQQFYTLDKTSGAAVSAPNVIATVLGSSNPARWSRSSGSISVTSSQVSNLSTVAGATVTAALDTLAPLLVPGQTYSVPLTQLNAAGTFEVFDAADVLTTGTWQVSWAAQVNFVQVGGDITIRTKIEGVTIHEAFYDVGFVNLIISDFLIVTGSVAGKDITIEVVVNDAPGVQVNITNLYVFAKKV